MTRLGLFWQSLEDGLGFTRQFGIGLSFGQGCQRLPRFGRGNALEHFQGAHRPQEVRRRALQPRRLDPGSDE